MQHMQHKFRIRSLSVKLQSEHRHVMVYTEAMYSDGSGFETKFRDRFL